MWTVRCQGCGRGFDSPRCPSRSRSFCTDECRRAHRKPPPPRPGYSLSNCAVCGKSFRLTATERARGRKYCSRKCYRLARAEADKRKVEQRKATPCSVCGKLGVGVKGLCSACDQQQRKERFIHAEAPPTGVCEQCGKPFRSKDARYFCSLKCYLASDRGKAIMAAARAKSFAAAGIEPGRRIELTCMHCGQAFKVHPSRAGKLTRTARHGPQRWYTTKFCSRICYRKWFAERYDRWIANPQTLALPQAYDEFLTKETLPCLVEGCDWVGLNLSQHMNFTHGVTAEEFKALAGFNRKTGVIAAPLHQTMVERMADRGNPAIGESWAKGLVDVHSRRGYLRLEGKEHLQKARAESRFRNEVGNARRLQERAAKWKAEHTSPCIICGKPAEPEMRWRTVRKTCSPECKREQLRRLHLKHPFKDYVCVVCGATFRANDPEGRKLCGRSACQVEWMCRLKAEQLERNRKAKIGDTSCSQPYLQP